MNERIIKDISDFIFISDEPSQSDAVFLPGGSHPAQPEYAAELYRNGYAKWLVPSGGVTSPARGTFSFFYLKNGTFCVF